MRLQQGSLPWLIRHEMRLLLRTSARLSWRLLLIVAVLLLGAVTIGGAPLAAALARHRDLLAHPGVVLAGDLMLAVLFSLMLSQALALAVQAFYARGDLDLLLSSPLSPRRLMFVRAGGIALAASGLYLVLALPLIAPAVARGQWALLGVLPMLAALGLAATATGLALALVLFATIGPRRARTVGQVLAALSGAFIVLLLQVPQFLPGHRAQLARWMHAALRHGWFAAHSVLALPLRAGLGAPGPLSGIVAGAALLFAGTVYWAGPLLPVYASRAAGASVRRGAARRARPFRTGTRSVLIRKELRLIARDPQLLSRVLLQLLYLLPLLVVMSGPGSSAHLFPATLFGVVLLTVVAGQLGGNLAWLTLSAEDAPELLRSAPLTAASAERVKLAAALIPLAILAVPFGVVAWFRPWAALCATFGATVSALSNALIQLWYVKPMPRSAFRRRGQGALLANLGGLFVTFGWAAVATLADYGTLHGTEAALALSAVPLGLLALLRFGRLRPQRPPYVRRWPSEPHITS